MMIVSYDTIIQTILDSLLEIVSNFKPAPLTDLDRLDLFKTQFQGQVFARKDYLNFFKTLSTSTASRDLLLGVRSKLIQKSGTQSKTKYRFN